MSLITFVVNDTLLVLDAEQIVQVFGLEDDEMPILRLGSFTPAADDSTIFVNFNGTFLGTEATNAARRSEYITKNGVQGISARGRIIVTGPTSGQTGPLPFVTPIPLHTQLAMVSNVTADHSVQFDYVKVKGEMRHKHNLEKLADRDRMFSAPPAGVPGHVMNAGLRNRMGDATSGF